MNKLLFFIFMLVCFNTSAKNQRDSSIKNDIIVSQDGSGNFKTIQEAINAVRDLGEKRVTIFIKRGIYHEKLVIPSWKTKISLVGESVEHTIVTNNDYSGKVKDGSGERYITQNSFTVLVQGADFIAENLTIENSAGRVGQAVALHVEGDRCAFRNCRIIGNQDTLYATNEGSRQFYRDCYIEGTTDFIFGSATVVFQHCTIKSKINSFITAAATTSRQQYGFVLINCKLIADTAVTKVYLGRPWRPYAKTVYIHCEMGSHILPEGWNPWKGDVMFPDKEKTAYYAEYESSGAGAFAKERVGWSKQLNKKRADLYTVQQILGGKDRWVP